MNLVQYSDSEASDEESTPQPKPESKKPAATAPPSKPAFQKVVDRSNPHKIRVNLPGTAAANTAKDDIDQEAPPAKRARTGGGAFSGFNSFLPAPKKTGSGGGSGTGAAQKGLGRGVNLKTGAAPAFSREAVTEDRVETGDDEGADVNEETPAQESVNGGSAARAERQEEVKLVGKPTVFKPLSVARSTKKKKKPALPPAAPMTATTEAVATKAAEPNVPPKPKISLFSIAQAESTPTSSTTNGQYTPLVYEPEQPSAPTEAADAPQGPSYSEPTAQTTTATTTQKPPPPPPGPQSLTALATTLNLSASARRQLLGRNAKAVDPSSINVIDFNTDAEYAANEALRAAGETVQHNPVRAIAPGKHSLKQLVNAASTQKEALEESWASGKGRRREAGGRYGW